MNHAAKVAVLVIIAAVIALTFIYLGMTMSYPDSVIIAFAGIAFALVLSFVMYFNTETPNY